MKNQIINIKELSHCYSKEEVLKNINISIYEKDFIALFGENGAGKSTLIKILLGLIKKQKGEIDAPCKIGYLPQKTNIQSNFPASVDEIVLSGTISSNIKKVFYSKENKRHASEVLKQLNIYDIRKKCFRDLSGGQQQRVLIARALCSTDKVLILDEPVNGLDPEMVTQIYELLKILNLENDLTIIMVSHDIDRAIKYCNRVISLNNGKVMFDGSVDKYIEKGQN